MRNNSDVICHCEGVTYKEIEDAIKNGYDTLEKLGDHLNVGIACGYCIEDLEEILEELITGQSSA